MSLISIIIPTRERAAFLRECLATAVAIRDDAVEIVVSDNASGDGTEGVVRGFADSRIRYVNTGARVSMRQNFEFALGRSSGEYVIFIGDDDAMLPGQFPALRLVLQRHRPDILGWCTVGYRWPGARKRGRVYPVRLRRSRTFGAVSSVPLEPWRSDLFAGRSPYPDPIPSAYHGCVSRAFLEGIRGRCGHAFGASSPDLFFSYFAAMTAPSYLLVRHCLSVSGSSSASTGAASARYRAGNAASRPAERFVAEAAADPVRDAVRHDLPVLPMALFSTFESARIAAGIDASKVDYRAWYRLVLSHILRDQPTLVDPARRLLEEHAVSVGAGGSFGSAADYMPAPGDAKPRLAKLRDGLSTIRLGTRRGGVNTVRTAAESIDAVISDDYVRVIGTGVAAGPAWTRARIRAAVSRIRCAAGLIGR